MEYDIKVVDLEDVGNKTEDFHNALSSNNTLNQSHFEGLQIIKTLQEKISKVKKGKKSMRVKMR